MESHLFVSVTGDLLPRWEEAFPAASSGCPENLPPGIACDIAWLRIDSGSPVAEQIAALQQQLGAVKCIVLSDQPNDEEALAAFAAAARGYCNAHANAALLRQVASVVMHGGLWIGESLMQRVISATARLLPPSVAPEPTSSTHWRTSLSERECEVAVLVARGSSNKEIARQLNITERTVKAHMGSALEKLKVRDRLQLALLVNQRVPA